MTVQQVLHGWVIATATLTLAGYAPAADKSPTFLDPAAAGPDFAIQGEYLGEIETSDGKLKLGAQVIAQGSGKFRASFYPSGLPGEGWDGKQRIEAESETVDGGVAFRNPEKGSATIKNGVMAVFNRDGQHRGDLARIERKSPTLGAKPPEGAVVLFDGSSADQFQGGRLTDDKLLMQGVTSKQTFHGFSMHLEFRTPFMPEAGGQARGNSGLYLQGRYEVQILDSFGLAGRNNECGGIYEIKDPDVNMCLPPLSWQTYDIDYTAPKFDDGGKKTVNARVTVRHNGVVIHNDVELPRATRGNPLEEGPRPGPVYMQDHGNPVYFRNIWVVEKK